MRKLMCIVAHPDDECFGFGGALALAAQAGVEVHVVCLTDGQAATNRGESNDAAELGRMRRDELARSCKVLGVAHHELLHFQDGHLEHHSLHDLAQPLVQRIRSVQPEAVVTFGLDGGLNAHADHTSVSAAASAAFHWSMRSNRYPELGAPFLPQRLYHLSSDFTFPDRQPVHPAPWNVRLDISSVRQLKEQAFLEHTSQVPVFDKIKPFWDRFGAFEYYLQQAGPGDAHASTPSDTMFPG